MVVIEFSRHVIRVIRGTKAKEILVLDRVTV